MGKLPDADGIVVGPLVHDNIEAVRAAEAWMIECNDSMNRVRDRESEISFRRPIGGKMGRNARWPAMRKRCWSEAGAYRS